MGRMYRSLHSETKGIRSAWYNYGAVKKGSFTLEQCDCMRVQYRYHLGWFKKLAGVVIILASLTVFAWNEKVAVDNSRSYHEGVHGIRILDNPDNVASENDGKLVHVSGYLDVHEALTDPVYGVSIRAVKLKRRVQMYQWLEHRDSLTDDVDSSLPTAFTYTKAWKDKLVDSSTFYMKEHNNPREFPIQSQIRVNSKVHLGNYVLGPELREKFGNFIQFTSGERPDQPDIKMHMGLYYHTNDIWNPSVGDLRIQFSFAGPADSYVSIVAKQVGNELRPYENQVGKTLSFIHEGKWNHIEMLDKEHSATSFTCWMFRSCAWIFTVFGTSMASSALTFMNRRNFVVQNLLSLGPTKFNFVFATFLCLSAIGSIWFHHKPLFSILVIIFSCSMLLYCCLVGPAENYDHVRYNYPSKRQYLPRYLSS